LNKTTQEKIFKYLNKNGIENFIGVPDSTMKHFINYGLENNKIIITTREEEAIGISVGFSLSKSKTLVFMQNAGFANSISTITSLVQLYNIPIIFLIGWRGYLKNDAPEHEKIGRIQPELIKALELQNKTLDKENWREKCEWALKKLQNNESCALIIRREFLD
tara:strand:+ start:3303 stop:3791 length:489 start_codon:yes stop_codon:yes gene_type:complete